MVTKMERASKNDASETKFQTELAGRAKDRVSAAIKVRNESFVTLREAAASAILLGVQFGRFEQFNRLFRDLPAIDAEALRNKYVAKVVETFGAGGVWDETEGKWTKRPVAFILYRTDDALRTAKDSEKGQNFVLRSTEAMKADDPMVALIKQGRENVIAAGEEGLMQVEWLNRGAMVNRTVDYDRDGFYKDLERLLQKAAKESLKPDSDISTSTITEIMRVAAMPKARKATVLDILSGTVANVNTPKQGTENNSDPQTATTMQEGKDEVKEQKAA